MTFNKTTTYAIMILSHMAGEHKMNYSATYLSKTLHIPLQYCRQLLTDLSKKGLLKSEHGRKGGFALAKSTAHITLSTVVEATEGMDSFNRCIMGFNSCPFDNQAHCVLHELWEETRGNFIQTLEQTSLDHFLKKS